MITLYINPHCPFCRKTLEAAKSLGLTVTTKDKNLPGVAEEVEALGGKRQYPFMVDSETGTKMYESTDIIAYLTARAKKV